MVSLMEGCSAIFKTNSLPRLKIGVVFLYLVRFRMFQLVEFYVALEQV